MKILITESENFSPSAFKALSDLGEVKSSDCDRKELLEIISDYHVIFIRLGHTINKELLDRAESLKIIVTPTTGLNHIDMDYADIKNVRILSLKDETDFLKNIHATAELTWGLLLSLIKNINASAADVIRGHWNRDEFIGNELSDKKLGIVGLGRLGTIVAGYGLAFNMKVQASDPSPEEVPTHVKMVPVEELMESSDIISIHIDLNPSNFKFINHDLLEKVKPGALLINTSRGEVIDESTLLNLLKSGQLKGAALDVLTGEKGQEPEWLSGNPLWEYAREHSNLIISPHIGGATRESMSKTEIFMAEKLKKYCLDHSIN